MTGTAGVRALAAHGLTVALTSGATVVQDVSLELRPHEILGLVGESGSGKTTTALALLGYARPGSSITAGRVRLGEVDVLALADRGRRGLRGSTISYVPQDAGQALNPSLRISDSILDVLRKHRTGGEQDVLQLLEAVDLPATTTFGRRLPHQLSGGQQQRVTIAMAMSCGPPVIVMDEPTTGLDVITQASVLDEIRRLRDVEGASLVYVSHDLAVIAQLADRVAVMYGGRIVEEGPTASILRKPQHPYTRGLVQSIPDHRTRGTLVAMPGVAVGVEDRGDGCSFAPRCAQRTDVCDTTLPPLVEVRAGWQVACLHWEDTPALSPTAIQDSALTATRDVVLAVKDLTASHRSGRETVLAASAVSFDLERGESLALVGQSGSGKTTIARCVVGLHRPDTGTIALDDEVLPAHVRRRTLEQRRRVQYVFQNPYQSLNPRRKVGDELARALTVLRGVSGAAARREVASLLATVRLPERLASRYPHQLSGGELQRVAIARALAAAPEILVCDEITSALDVSVQAAILELLADLRRELGLSMLLITHDLGVVSVAADSVMVLEHGAIVELGSVAAVLDDPQHPYTRRLLDAAPTLESPRATQVIHPENERPFSDNNV